MNYIRYLPNLPTPIDIQSLLLYFVPNLNITTQNNFKSLLSEITISFLCDECSLVSLINTSTASIVLGFEILGCLEAIPILLKSSANTNPKLIPILFYSFCKTRSSIIETCKGFDLISEVSFGLKLGNEDFMKLFKFLLKLKENKRSSDDNGAQSKKVQIISKLSN